jgi:iron complex outermembrane receptor protein
MLLLVFANRAKLSAEQQDPNKQRELFEMSIEDLMSVEVVTPSRKPQTIDTAPSNITVITEQEIRDSGAQTLAELLERLSGIYIPTQGHGDESIYVRGVGERYNDKTLLMVDGYPFRDLYYYSYPLNATIPLMNIKRIEVIRGPGSSLYGTNAFAGVINIITKDPKDIQGSELGSGIGSHGTEQYHMLWGTQGKDAGLSILARYLDADLGQIDADEKGEPSGKTRFFENKTVHLKANYKDIDFQAGYYRTEMPDFMEPIETEDVRTQQDAFFRLGYTRDISDRLNMRARAYSNLLWADEEVREFDAGVLDKYKDDSRQSDIMGVDVQWRYDLSQMNNLLFGVSHEREHLHHQWSREFDPPGSAPQFSGWVSSDQQPFPTEVRTYNSAIYAEDEIRLIPDVLSLTVGARMDDYKQTGSRLSPRFGAVWTPLKRTVVKLLYGEAFRSPSYRELFKQSDDGTSEGDPHLKPEVLKTVELGISQYFSGSHRLEVSLFQSHLEDFIKTVGDGNYTNLDHRCFQGVEVGLKGLLPAADLRYFTNYTLLDTKEHGRTDIGGIPDEMFNIGLTYEGLTAISISPYLRYVGERNRPSDYQDDVDAENRRNRLGGYPVFNIAVRTKKQHPFELAFLVQNVLDEQYYTVSEKSYKYDVEGPGRTFWLTLTYRF